MVEKWNSKYEFPTDSGFVNRITDFAFDASKNTGNPMIKLHCEVVSLNGSPEVEIGGRQYNIAGIETDNYFVTGDAEALSDPKADEADKAAKDRLFSKDGLFTILGIERDKVDWNNLKPLLDPFKGKLVLTQMSPDRVEQTKPPTPAQLEAGRKKGLKDNAIKGDVMNHPVTGKPLVNYFAKVRTIFGLAPSQDGMGVPY